MTPADYKRTLVATMNAHDLPATLELIADDAIYFWSNGSAYFGKPAIGEALRANFEGIQNDVYEALDVTWLAQSDTVAACAFKFQWTGEIDGKPAGGQGRGTSVITLVDGAWRTAHEHLSLGRWKPVEDR